jgi:beta-galactosidase
MAGGRKPSYYQRAAYWRDDPVLQLFVLTDEKPEHAWRPAPALIKWNWPAGAQVTVRAAANCDEVELFLNDRSLGRHAVSHDVYASDWTVPYVPGTLSAVGYRAGRQVAAQEIRTTGAPARLAFAAIQPAVPSDLAFYEITVVDRNGLVVTDATPVVKVRVKGAGRLIGLDTGDLDYGGLFKVARRAAYRGRLLATVQRTALTGELRISAAAPGLPTATIVLPAGADATGAGANR